MYRVGIFEEKWCKLERIPCAERETLSDYDNLSEVLHGNGSSSGHWWPTRWARSKQQKTHLRLTREPKRSYERKGLRCSSHERLSPDNIYIRSKEDCRQLKSNMSPDNERVLPTVCRASEEDENECSSKKSKLAEADDYLAVDESYRSSKAEYVPQITWPDLIAQIFIHVGFVYGLYLIFTEAKLLTLLWAFVCIYTSGFGITAGAHRLWSHRAYKAKWPLRLLLIFLFTISGQKHVYAWALDHRVHHKYSETDADPHNAKRGFFFAHIGWLFTTPHPDVILKRKAVDMSDLEADPIVMWQKRFYIPLFALLTIGLPVAVPCYLWSESLWTSFWVNFNFRFCVTLNIAFFVNSVAHMWGQRPYDKNISPVENIAVSIAALGEGWHNFHHVFPWDYKTGELGNYSFNMTTGFIDTFARIGWAYDRKYVSPAMVRRRAERSGDGSHVWGYGDADISADDLRELKSMDKKDQ